MESEFLKMDLFFVIASTFCVVIGVLISLILWKVLKIVGRVEEASNNIKLVIKKMKNWLKILKK